MKGIICMWHGLLVDIPNGWALCDGENGTPDLRERFVRGAADGIDPGGIGGSSAHVHEGWGRDEVDYLDFGEWIASAYPEGDYDELTVGHGHMLDIYSSSHLPPYYDIAFIMKL